MHYLTVGSHLFQKILNFLFHAHQLISICLWLLWTYPSFGYVMVVLLEASRRCSVTLKHQRCASLHASRLPRLVQPTAGLLYAPISPFTHTRPFLYVLPLSWGCLHTQQNINYFVAQPSTKLYRYIL